ncbi:MAG: tetratricopeptide repeat protein [Candidatus Uhrbacteria bacterium]
MASNNSARSIRTIGAADSTADTLSSNDDRASSVSGKRAARWETIARWILFVTVFLVPLTFVPGAPNILGITQQTAVLLLALIVATCSIVGILARGTVSFPRINWMIGVAFVVLIAAVVASILGAPALRMSIWGDNGIQIDVAITLLSALLVGVLTATLITTVRAGERLIAVIRWSALLALVLVAANVVVNSVFHFAIFGAIGDTPVGTMNMFSVFLGVAFVLSFGTFIGGSSSRFTRIASGITALVCFLAIIAHGHQQTLLAVFIGLILFLALWLAEHSHAVHGKLLVLNTILFAAFLSLMLAFAGYRWTAAFNFPAEAMPSQRTSWNVALDALGSGVKPALIGNGPATYAATFQQLKPIAINLTPLWAVDFRQGASYWATFLPSYGAIATIAFLALIIAIFFWSFRGMTTSVGAHGSLRSLYAAAVTFAIASFLYPWSATLLVLLAILLGLLVGLSAAATNRTATVALFQSPQRAFFGSLLLSGAFVLALAVIVVGVKRYVAVAEAQGALNSFSRGAITRETATARIAQSFNWFPAASTARALSQQSLGVLVERARTMNDQNAAALRPQVQAALSGAVQLAQRATELDPSDARNWAALGDVYQGVIGIVDGADRLALDAYTHAQKTAPTSPTYPVAIAQVHLIRAAQKDADITAAVAEAHRALDEALRLKSDYSTAYLLRAQAYEREGKLEEATTSLRELSRRRPDDLGTLFALGALEYRAGHLDAASEVFTRAIAQQPNYANAKYFLGRIAEDRGDRAEAIRQYEAVLEFNPDNEEITGRLERLRGNTEKKEEGAAVGQ